MSGIYNFNPDDAFRFASFVGIEAKQRGNELMFKVCPYCRPSDRKNFNTFSINLSTGQYKCLRAKCNVSGNMLTLSRDFNFTLNRDTDEYYKPKKYREFKQPEKPIKPNQKAIDYLESRGIPAEIAERYEITVRKDNENILVFPFYDDRGKMKFIKYRDTLYGKPGGGQNKEFCEKDGQAILFGMKQCSLEASRTLVLTEGQLDSLSVAAAGVPNAVSVPTGQSGKTWVPHCWDFVQQFDEIIVFGDFENGENSLVEMARRFSNKILKTVREEDYRGCKDANLIIQKHGPEAVKNAVERAVPLPVRRLVSLGDVKRVDLYKIEKLPTGITHLDSALRGGIPLGGLTVITGKRGSGKSTFASQIVVNALERGHSVLAYSGELTGSLFKSWIDFQIAGPDFVREINSEYMIESDILTRIEQWYSERMFIYNDSPEIEDCEDLIATLEKGICQYGARVVLIDNLMTAMFQSGTAATNLYERQSDFTRKLAEMAVRYDVVVILVAHQRKNSSEDVCDSVSGSADIGNLASVVVGYDRLDDVPQEDRDNYPHDFRLDRKVTLAKNRLFGITNYEGWRVGFHAPSRRIGDFERASLSWVNGENGGFYAIQTEIEDVPF